MDRMSLIGDRANKENLDFQIIDKHYDTVKPIDQKKEDMTIKEPQLLDIIKNPEMWHDLRDVIS